MSSPEVMNVMNVYLGLGMEGRLNVVGVARRKCTNIQIGDESLIYSVVTELLVGYVIRSDVAIKR